MLTHPRSLALLLSVGVLTGCAVGPAYQPPESALTTTFVGQEGAHAEYEASAARVVATRLTVAAHTADVYVTIRGPQSRIAIARQQVETRRQLLAFRRALGSGWDAPHASVTGRKKARIARAFQTGCASKGVVGQARATRPNTRSSAAAVSGPSVPGSGTVHRLTSDALMLTPRNAFAS